MNQIKEEKSFNNLKCVIMDVKKFDERLQCEMNKKTSEDTVGGK